jgi:hypothetical protein
VIDYESSEQLDVEPVKYTFSGVTKREKRGCESATIQSLNRMSTPGPTLIEPI